MPMALEELWRTYADTGPADDAPTYRAIAHSIAGDPELLAVARAAPPETHHPNHLLAAVRFLMLGGLDHPLAVAYDDGDVDGAVVAFRAFVLEHRDEILEVLATQRVQTNEVGRSALIGPALAWVAEQHGVVGLVDVGTSAGLNLLVDRCVTVADDPGGLEGDLLRVPCDVTGTPPTAFRIGWRLGLDRSPVDLDDEASARWLLSCVWVDQQDRIQRLTEAIELARRYPSPIVRGDAVEALPAVVAEAPDNVHLVVLTTWVAFYLDTRQRIAFEDILCHSARPVTWITIEHPGVIDLPTPPPHRQTGIAPSVVGAVSFPGDGYPPERRALGWAHPHGRWLDWFG